MLPAPTEEEEEELVVQGTDLEEEAPVVAGEWVDNPPGTTPQPHDAREAAQAAKAAKAAELLAWVKLRILSMDDIRPEMGDYPSTISRGFKLGAWRSKLVAATDAETLKRLFLELLEDGIRQQDCFQMKLNKLLRGQAYPEQPRWVGVDSHPAPPRGATAAELLELAQSYWEKYDVDRAAKLADVQVYGIDAYCNGASSCCCVIS